MKHNFFPYPVSPSTFPLRKGLENQTLSRRSPTSCGPGFLVVITWPRVIPLMLWRGPLARPFCSSDLGYPFGESFFESPMSINWAFSHLPTSSKDKKSPSSGSGQEISAINLKQRLSFNAKKEKL